MWIIPHPPSPTDVSREPTDSYTLIVIHIQAFNFSAYYSTPLWNTFRANHQ